MSHPDDHPFLRVAEGAVVHPLALIEPSERGTLIEIGPHSRIYAFAVIKAIGGSGDVIIGEHCHINSHCVLSLQLLNPFSFHGNRQAHF